MTRELEKEAIEQLTRQLTEEGYIVHVGREAHAILPKALQTIVPDLVVQRGEENIVIEIKVKGSKHENFALLAERVRQQPGWRMDVHLIEPKTASAKPPTIDEMKENVASSERLFANGDEVAALLLLWSVFEAAGVAALQEQLGDSAAAIDHASLVKQLTYQGLIEDPDHDKLLDIQALRNRLAHGQLDTPLDKNAFQFLVKAIRRLLKSSRPGSWAA